MSTYPDAALDPSYELDAPRPRLGHERGFREPRFECDPEPVRPLRSRLIGLICKGRSKAHKPGLWGFCIVRTCYDNDDQFQHALAVIDAAVAYSSAEEARCTERTISEIKTKRWPEFQKRDWELDRATIPDHCDPRPNQELLARYSNDILQDREHLAGADDAKVREYFDTWVLSRGEPRNRLAFPRYDACFVLDADTLRRLATVDTANIEAVVRPSLSKPPPCWLKVMERQIQELYYPMHIPQHDEPKRPLPSTWRLGLFDGAYDLVDYWWTRFEAEPDFEIRPYLRNLGDPDPDARYYSDPSFSF
ncbi:uncharacterized protein B0I36DRAFT_143370 [Microdochium trichocladiopsis]|uniref:Uncharacterized protein n=1 Tax=Microdochium trichocladiopsis TaxID=1682393 RepID=A0A9P8Y235_9PEZI|nr:uncharacterized protein B0I36DRAFT_143370 [Microdochium trichocladiopsis]KAH7027780.1 hypothetical protein B0I36DRAFT_143370 [Microdochium trichocladiopsis]